MRRTWLLVCLLLVFVSGCTSVKHVDYDKGKVNTKIMAAVSQMKATSNRKEQLQIVANNIELCTSVHDVIALANSSSLYGEKDSVLRAGISFCKSVDEVALLAENANFSGTKNEIALKGKAFVKRASDFAVLSKYAGNMTGKRYIENARNEYLKNSRSVYESNNPKPRYKGFFHDGKLIPKKQIPKKTKKEAYVSWPANMPRGANIAQPTAYDIMIKAKRAYQKAVEDSYPHKEIQALAEEYRQQKDKFYQSIGK
jgi:hypothetical protein